MVRTRVEIRTRIMGMETIRTRIRITTTRTRIRGMAVTIVRGRTAAAARERMPGRPTMIARTMEAAGIVFLLCRKRLGAETFRRGLFWQIRLQPAKIRCTPL